MNAKENDIKNQPTLFPGYGCCVVLKDNPNMINGHLYAINVHNPWLNALNIPA